MNDEANKLVEDSISYVQNDLLMKFSFLDKAFQQLELKLSDTYNITSDGKCIYCNGEYILKLFLDNTESLTKQYLHTVLHCILQHQFDKSHIDFNIWNLACDIAVENIIIQLLKNTDNSEQLKEIKKLKEAIGSMTAENIYDYYMEHRLIPKRYDYLCGLFKGDEHEIWYSESSQETPIDYDDIFNNDNESESEIDDDTPSDKSNSDNELTDDLPNLDSENTDENIAYSDEATDSKQDTDSLSDNSESENNSSNQVNADSINNITDSDENADSEQNASSLSDDSESENNLSNQLPTNSNNNMTHSDEITDSEPDDNTHSDKNESDIQDTWKRISRQMQLELEMRKTEEKNLESSDMLQNLKALNREETNYADFLRKFAVFGEEMQIDDDSFDYIFYTYGLSVYKNIPLVEPLEYKEVKRIREFVIAIDTSCSVKGETVQAFIQKTYNIMKQQESFFSKVNIHIIQCDYRIQSDIKITSQKDFEEFINNMELKGFSGTDFRPVFHYVEELRRKGELKNLQGLIYFTDGYGDFPSKPDYKTAFVFLENQNNNPDIPPWAMKVILSDKQIKEF